MTFEKNQLKYVILFLASFIWQYLGRYIIVIPIILFESLFNENFQSLNIFMESTEFSSITIIADMIAKLILIIILFILLKNEIKDKIKDIKNNLYWYFDLILVGSILLCLISSGFDELFKIWNITGTSNNQNSIIELLSGDAGFIMAISTVLLAPIVEELIFRKFIFYSFKGRIPKWLIVLLSSLIFAVIHLSSFNEIIFLLPYFGLSLVLTLSYAATDNLVVPISIHMLNNLIILILL